MESMEKKKKTYNSIQEIDAELTALTKLLQGETDEALKEILRVAIDGLLALRQERKEQEDTIKTLPDISGLAKVIGKGDVEKGMEILMKNSFYVGPIEE